MEIEWRLARGARTGAEDPGGERAGSGADSASRTRRRRSCPSENIEIRRQSCPASRSGRSGAAPGLGIRARDPAWSAKPGRSARLDRPRPRPCAPSTDCSHLLTDGVGRRRADRQAAPRAAGPERAEPGPRRHSLRASGPPARRPRRTARPRSPSARPCGRAEGGPRPLGRDARAARALAGAERWGASGTGCARWVTSTATAWRTCSSAGRGAPVRAVVAGEGARSGRSEVLRTRLRRGRPRRRRPRRTARHVADPMVLRAGSTGELLGLGSGVGAEELTALEDLDGDGLLDFLVQASAERLILSAAGGRSADLRVRGRAGRSRSLGPCLRRPRPRGGRRGLRRSRRRWPV